MSRSDPDLELLEGVRSGDRRALSRAITLIESTRPDHRERADILLDALQPATGKGLRLGISGAPGVGKSTFIEALGLMLVARNHRVAVLAVDPSSGVSGGSILGDKTRMERLSVMESAYIRPSPSAGMLGGVAARTRETALVCEVAGFDIVILETVGVGQSEVAVADMVDVFALLQLPNAGDGLQAMKKGVMERADLIVVNKCDLDPLAASRAETEIAGALRALRAAGNPRHGAERGQPRIVQASALRATGIDRFWEEVRAFESAQRSSGEFDARRRRQALAWTWDCIQSQILAGFRGDPSVREALPATLRAVEEARLTPTAAARALVSLFRGRELES